MKTQQAPATCQRQKASPGRSHANARAKDAAIETAEKRAQTNAARAAAAVLMLTACAHNSPVCLPESPATDAAVREYAAAASAVLGECIGEYQALAGQADQHANDARLMRRSVA